MKAIIRIFFKTIRAIVGPVLLLIEKLTSRPGIQRTQEHQQEVDQQTSDLALYQFKTCPFCIKTRRAIRRLSLNIETRDAQHNTVYRQELLDKGGQIKVPCLHIKNENGDEQWLYESADIIRYLEQRFQ